MEKLEVEYEMKPLFRRINGAIVVLLLAAVFAPQVPTHDEGAVYAAGAGTLPELTITEILANSNGDGTSIADAYEYVELKNNSNRPIDLADYKFTFWWRPDRYVVWDMTASQTIAPGEIRVVWIKNQDAQGKTLQHFNAHYGTNFTASTLYILDIGYNGGLGNDGIKKLILMKDDGTEVCIAQYNDRIFDSLTNNEDARVENSSIVYEFPHYPVPGNITMRMIDSNQKPTPGTIPEPPSIWITEIMVNSSSPVDDLEAFEFIELYNNTPSPIDLSAYTIRYYWNHANLNDYYDFDLTQNKNIPAYGRIAVWLRGTQSAGYTLSQFAEHYHLPSTYLTADKVYEVTISQASALGNAGQKTVELRTDAGQVIVSATYNDGTSQPGSTRVDTQEDTSIIYGCPVDGTKIMRKLVSGQKPTPAGAYNFFYGDLHNHTHHSHDSNQTPTNSPETAFTTTRNKGADFFAISDHSEQVDEGEPDVPNGDWTDIRHQAGNKTEKYKFTAIGGYEMTYNTLSGIWGHLNIFNTSWIVDRNDHINGVQYTLHDLWDDLARHPEAFAQFNHPSAYWGDFEDFAYYNKAADDQMALFEFIDHPNVEEYFAKFIRALDKGWHVSPSLNGDKHREDWLASNDRTVVLAEVNTKDAIFDAMRHRRTYASFGDADFRLLFEINGQIMGSRLANPGPTLNVSVVAANPTNDTISKVTLYGPGGQILDTQTFNSRLVHYTKTIPNRYKYYFVRVEQTDGDWAVSAPIWIEDSLGTEITMSTQSTSLPNVPVQINAHVHNTTGSALSNVLVEFYKDDFKSHTDNYKDANKVGETVLPSIPAGGTAVASTTWAPVNGVGTYHVLVRATATVNGMQKSSTAGIHMPELYITEIVANSPGNTGVPDTSGLGWPDDIVDEDYDFIEIYNNSKNAVNLKYFKIKDTYEDPVDITEDFWIPGKSVKVIWFKKTGSTKTLADFNAAYGTNLTGDDVLELYQTSPKRPDNPLRFSGMGRIELVRDHDNASILQAKYNNGVNTREVTGPPGTGGTHPSVDGKALTFKYPVDGSYYLERLQTNVPPTPGEVTSDQIAP